MAKKKAKKPATRRRRISGVNTGQVISKIGGALVGYVGAKMLSNKVMPNLDEKIKGAAVVALGVFAVPRFIKGPMGEGLSIGMAVAGGDTLLRGTGLIAGIMDKPMLYLPAGQRVAGDGINNTVGGTDGIVNTVAGYNTYKRSRAEA